MILPLLFLLQTSATAPRPARAAAAVVFHGDTLFAPRVALGPVTAADRVAAALRHLETAWAGRAAGDSVWIAPLPEGSEIGIGSVALFAVLPGDSVAPGTVAARVQAHWASPPEPASWSGILLAALRALVALVGALLAWRLLLRLGHRVKRMILPAITRWVRDLKVGDFTLVRGRAIRRTAEWLVDLPLWAAVALLLYLATSYGLLQFPATQELGRGLGRTLLATVGGLLLRAAEVVPDLLLAAVLLLGMRAVVRLSNAFFEAIEDGTLELPAIHPDVARPTRKLVAVLLWLFALVLVYPLLPGSDSSVFKGVSIFLGVLVSLGSTGVVANAMSGLVVMYSRAFKPGDYIEVDATQGEVLELGMLATKLRTPKHVEVTIPNAVLVTHGVRNYSRLAEERGVLLQTTVTLGYDTPWRTIHETLVAAARQVPGVRQEPAPFVLQTALNDFHVSYELNVHVDDPIETPRILDALHAQIQDGCNAAGIEILSPAFQVRRSGPADTRLPKERWGGAAGSA